MDAEPLLRHSEDRVAGFVDFHGTPALRSSGGWTSAAFIIGVEIAERFAYYGVSLNLISYLTGTLRQSTASAAASVNVWTGVSSVLPLLGAFVADSYLGRYRTIVFASVLYVIGLGMLTLSTVLPALRPPECRDTMASTICKPSLSQVAFFYFSLYLMAFAQGGHKPCVQAFGADQFDQNDPQESKSRSSFFNWWYFGMCGGIVVAVSILSYVQDNIGWSLGFAIPTIAMIIALLVFLIGIKTYRFYPIIESPFSQIGKKLWEIARNKGIILCEAEECKGRHQTEPSCRCSSQMLSNTYLSNINQAEEAEGLLRLFPIWASCLVYAVVFAQPPTLFTKQGSTLDRRIGSSFQVPPAALQSFKFCCIVLMMPVYDRLLVPIVRRYSKLPSGITMLQRIGTGMVISTVSMVIAALVEMKRLKTVKDLGLVDQPDTIIPMSLWWLVPQYVLIGASEAFTMVGLQEFFYDQVPDGLRSLGLALYLSIFGVGSFISSILISLIDRVTMSRGESWFADNLNKGHLDYFYWLLAGLSALDILFFLYFAQAYSYKGSSSEEISANSCA